MDRGGAQSGGRKRFDSVADSNSARRSGVAKLPGTSRVVYVALRGVGCIFRLRWAKAASDSVIMMTA